MINEKALADFFAKIKDDEAFAKSVVDAQEPKAVLGLAKESGIELTEDDVIAAKEFLVKAMEQGDKSELSEEELENVAGGLVVTTGLLVTLGVIGAAATIGGALITGGATIAASTIKTWKW